MKEIYLFTEGNMKMRDLLGGKGANLAEMTNLGIPVPKGFTITTAACHAFQETNQLSESLLQELDDALNTLANESGKKFNDLSNPLLVSVRSGAPISMPGMMDTILNIGLNDETVKTLAEITNNPRFAYDSYRRLLAMFGNVVYGIDEQSFDDILTATKNANHYQSDLELTTDDLKQIVADFKQLYSQSSAGTFPQDPQAQLLDAITAVFESWNNHRAIVYRRENNIPADLGTAVNVCEMVFGNAGADSGTGVAFTRDPATGTNALFGEYLLNAQGEDVVSGVRTPQPVSTLQTTMPDVYEELAKIATTLEQHYHDMQDIEFTIEHGQLFLLQARDGKRTTAAALKIAVDQVDEGLITKKQALMRLKPDDLSEMLHPEFEEATLASSTPLASGLPASPGAASGQAYFTADKAKAARDAGKEVILVRQDTSPEDIDGMVASNAIVTARGGMTSHAAVVARGMGATAVVGVQALHVTDSSASVDDLVINEGDWLSVDGANGHLYLGQLPTTEAKLNDDLDTFLDWAKETARMQVYTNADTPQDLQKALDFGADGVGLVRTEHMFFKQERLIHMRRMILAETAEERKDPLDQLAKMQETDFYALYKLAGVKSITIRLLDPPLHEFLPHDAHEIQTVAKQLDMDSAALKARVDSLKEVNPMLGHRGDRLAVTYPDIYQMQVRAMMNAVCRLATEGLTVTPHVMIPLTNTAVEMQWMRELVSNVIEEIAADHNLDINYEVGTMIETPRACVTSAQIAESADFFSFGTNDLTQLTFAYSRDDIASFVGAYLDKGLLPTDPFQHLDQEGVGEMMRLAVTGGRQTNPELPIGVCGEIGGDPQSTDFFEKINISYVSCSPYRVPVARLATAQATIKNEVSEKAFA